MKVKSPAQPDDMRPEYNFDYSTAVRGKYYRRIMREGANVAVLEPDAAKVFRDSAKEQGLGAGEFWILDLGLTLPTAS